MGTIFEQVVPSVGCEGLDAPAQRRNHHAPCPKYLCHIPRGKSGFQFPQDAPGPHREYGRTCNSLFTMQLLLIMGVPRRTSVPLSVDILSFVKGTSGRNITARRAGRPTSPPPPSCTSRLSMGTSRTGPHVYNISRPGSSQTPYNPTSGAEHRYCTTHGQAIHTGLGSSGWETGSTL